MEVRRKTMNNKTTWNIYFCLSGGMFKNSNILRFLRHALIVRTQYEIILLTSVQGANVDSVSMQQIKHTKASVEHYSHQSVKHQCHLS